MKYINVTDVEQLIHFGANRDIRKLAQWCLKLVHDGMYKNQHEFSKLLRKCND